MNKTILIAIMFSAMGLAACDKPTVVNVPAPEAIPGPAGATGATGEQGVQGDSGVKGNPGSQGDTGKTGDGTTVIVIPPTDPATSN